MGRIYMCPNVNCPGHNFEGEFDGRCPSCGQQRVPVKLTKIEDSADFSKGYKYQSNEYEKGY